LPTQFTALNYTPAIGARIVIPIETSEKLLNRPATGHAPTAYPPRGQLYATHTLTTPSPQRADVWVRLQKSWQIGQENGLIQINVVEQVSAYLLGRN